MNPVSYIYVVGRMCMTLSIFDLVQSVRALHIEYTAFCTPFKLAHNKCRTETFAKRNTKKRPQSYLPVLRYEKCGGGGSNIEFVRPFCSPAYNRIDAMANEKATGIQRCTMICHCVEWLCSFTLHQRRFLCFLPFCCYQSELGFGDGGPTNNGWI